MAFSTQTFDCIYSTGRAVESCKKLKDEVSEEVVGQDCNRGNTKTLEMKYVRISTSVRAIRPRRTWPFRLS